MQPESEETNPELTEPAEPTEPEETTEPAETTRSSLWQRLTNVFVSPGEVFDEVRESVSSTANWLVPTLLATVMGVVFVQVAFSQPNVLQDIREQQAKAFQKNIEAGKMTEKQAEQARQSMEKIGPVLMRVTGSVGAVFVSFAFLFLTALGIYLLGAAPSPSKRWPRRIGAVGLGFMAALMSFPLTGSMSMLSKSAIFLATGPVAFCLAILLMRLIDRFNPFGGSFSYMKTVEVVGLTSMISLLGAVIAIFLVIIKGSMMVSLGPALLLNHLDATNTTHRLLAAVNVMTFWYVAVLATGLASLSGSSFLKSALWLFGFWFLFRVVPILASGGWG